MPIHLRHTKLLLWALLILTGTLLPVSIQAQLIFLQGDAEPIKPFVAPDAADRAMAKKNHLKASLRFGYLSDNKSAESLRRRTEYNFEGFPTTTYDFSPTGTIEVKKEYQYDAKGLRIVFANIEQYSKTSDLLYALSYKFDDHNRLLEYSEKNGQGHARRMTYTYNSKGKLELLQYIEPDGLPGGAERYTYDASGKSVSMDKTDLAGDLVERVVWALDAKGRIIAEQRYLGGPVPLLLLNYKYLYDSKGQLIRKEKYSRDLILNAWETWVYDSGGNATEHKILETGEAKPSRIACKYDKAGRLTESIHYNGDGSVFQWYQYVFDSLHTGAMMRRLLPNGTVDFEKIEVFNQRRQPLSIVEHYPDGSGTHKIFFKYSDDGLASEEKHLSFDEEIAVFWFVHERY
jgi:YD repeat-containing protein